MDTIFALSSGRPPAAVSIIRISGPKALEAGRQVAGSLPGARSASVRTLKRPSTGDVLDEGLVLRFDAPASSTGEDVIEFHCHGGRAVVDAVLCALASLDGLREALPGEFTRRAFENGRIDLTEAEGLADLLEAETEGQRKAALALAEGGLRKQIDVWRDRLVSLSAAAELAIDYDEEDALAADPELILGCRELLRDLEEWLARPRVEPLKVGVRVVIAGPPNAGKSSLINALAGTDKAIVTDVPGTTRDQIEVPLAIDGVPIILIDTAGLRETQDKVEAIGVARAAASIDAADVLVWLGEAALAPPHDRLIPIYAQADRPERGPAPAGTLSVSARTGFGLGELLSAIGATARSILPQEGALVLNRRQAGLIAEAADALRGIENTHDVLLIAESLRLARSAFDRLTGHSTVEDVLDALFGRFCLGK